MAILNSNPEVLLRKRKDADRKRVAKQDELRLKRENRVKKAAVPKDKFVRAETLAIRKGVNALEEKRLANIMKHEQQNALRVSSTKEVDPKLVFVIRIPQQNKNVRIPKKAEDVLKVLRLDQPHSGVFVKLTPTVEPALKLVAPYIVVGKPSLASVRQLFQKRARIFEDDALVKLDNNQAVEDKFGDDLGFICIEDIIHEIVNLGDGFKAVTRWVAPFAMTAPVHGYGPLAKLRKIRYAEENKKANRLAGHLSLEEIDIDKFIEEQN